MPSPYLLYELFCYDGTCLHSAQATANSSRDCKQSQSTLALALALPHSICMTALQPSCTVPSHQIHDATSDSPCYLLKHPSDSN
eukprot:1848836-Amphidinium_carterae.2